MSQLSDLLAHAEVFDSLTDAQRSEFAVLARRRTLEKKEILCYEGDPWPYVAYIGSGSLRSVINSVDGRSYVVSVWPKGEVFWGHSVFDECPMPSTLEAVTASHLYLWDGEQALQTVLRSEKATRMLLRRQTQMIRLRRQNIHSLAFSPVASRLAKLIADRFEDSAEPTVQRDLTLNEMAERVATSPEVVCRLLYQFQANGTLSVSRASITLHDREALKKMIVAE